MNHEEFNEYLSETFESAARFASLFKWLLPRMECSHSKWPEYIQHIKRLKAEPLSQEAIIFLGSLDTEDIQEDIWPWFDRGIRWSEHHGAKGGLYWGDIRDSITITDPKPTRTIGLTGVL